MDGAREQGRAWSPSAAAAVAGILGQVEEELRARPGGGPAVAAETARAVAEACRDLLERIACLAWDGAIDPSLPVRLSRADPVLPAPARAAARTPRLGIFPVAADPLHWGHVLCGLTAAAEAALDRVVFIVAGRDPRKPWMSAETVRHALARSAIGLLEPLFAFSPIAAGTCLDGETNALRLLSLNGHLPLDAFYIAGTDHMRRRDAAGRPDTIEKLESLAGDLARASAPHRLCALFLERARERGDPACLRGVRIPARVLRTPAVACSSTAIREALSRGACAEAAAAVPRREYELIRGAGLYGAPPLHAGEFTS